MIGLGAVIRAQPSKGNILNAEVWLPIDGFHGFYEVSSLGNVRSLPREIVTSNGRSWIQPGKTMTIGRHHNGGYSTVVLCKNNKPRAYLVHRLVASAFHENKDSLPEVNHKDGVKSNNQASNLEWSLRQWNIDHAVRHRLIDNKGEKNQRAKLTEPEIREIRALHSAGYNSTEIAKLTRATKRNVKNITSRISWKHLPTAA